MKSFQKGPPPQKAKLKRWWTYLSQVRLRVHHIPGIKNELSDYISRNNLFNRAFSPLAVLWCLIHNCKWIRLIQNLSQSLLTLLRLLYSTEALLFSATCSFAVHHRDDS